MEQLSPKWCPPSDSPPVRAYPLDAPSQAFHFALQSARPSRLPIYHADACISSIRSIVYHGLTDFYFIKISIVTLPLPSNSVIFVAFLSVMCPRRVYAHALEP